MTEKTEKVIEHVKKEEIGELKTEHPSSKTAEQENKDKGAPQSDLVVNDKVKVESEIPGLIASIAPKKEKPKEERAGIAYIYSTFNNTMVHITDLVGNTISRVTGGMVTKHSRLKASPTIAMFVAKKAAERARDLGITSLYIRTRGETGETGLGPGGHAAVKSLGKEGFRIISILDTTKVARGGPKRKGGKRGRRV